MFCPKCGTRINASAGRFCPECGGEIAASAGQGSAGGGPGYQSASSSGQSTPPYSAWPAYVVVKNRSRSPLLIAAVIVLALPLLFGAVMASLVAGVALIALAFKALPLIAVGLIVYLILTHQRHAPHTR